MREEYNGELSIIDTEEKAYLLGLLYSDGCMSDKGNHQLNIRISLADKEIIQKLHKVFPFFNYEEFDFGKYSKMQQRQYALRRTSKELYHDLILQGMLPRKSGVNKENLSIPAIDQKLLHHFVRGYFDGDGSISIPKTRPNLRRAEICSVSENFMLQLRRLLIGEQMGSLYFRKKEASGRGKLPMYIIEWISSDDIINLKNYLYKNCTIFLDRKKALFDSFEKPDKKKYNPNCPNCNSVGMCTKGSGRKMNYGWAFRYYCHNCNKRFTIRTAQVKPEELLEKPEEANQQPSLELNAL